MSHIPYEQLEAEELILRDHLAIDRTALANERTFLAYIRTALAFVLAGASALHFIDSIFATVFGWVFMFCGVLIFFFGFRRYRQVQLILKKRF